MVATCGRVWHAAMVGAWGTLHLCLWQLSMTCGICVCSGWAQGGMAGVGWLGGGDVYTCSGWVGVHGISKICAEPLTIPRPDPLMRGGC